MSLSGSILTTCRLILENSRPFSLGKRGHDDCESFTIQNHNVNCEDSVKLLGVTIDYMLNFDLHFSDICKKAAKQINALCRLSQYLTTETKYLFISPL